MEDANGREWWQIAIRGPWYWPVWKYVNRVLVTPDGIRLEPAEWVTKADAMDAMRAIRDKLRAQTTTVVHEVVS